MATATSQGPTTETPDVAPESSQSPRGSFLDLPSALIAGGPAALAALQRAAGNRAVGMLMRGRGSPAGAQPPPGRSVAGAAQAAGILAPQGTNARAHVALSLQRAAGNAAFCRVLARAGELAEMRTTAGYQALTVAERARLDALVGGSTSVSKQAPAELRKILNDAASDKADPATFRTFISDEKYLNPVSLAGATRLTAKEFTLGPASQVADHEFRPISADAVLRTVTVQIPALLGSRRFDVPIFAPKTFKEPRPGAMLPSHDVTAQVLAELPVESLMQITEVHLNPWPNPDDVSLAADPKYNLGGGTFASYMSAGADGVVHIYPSSVSADLKKITKSLLHETGHTVSLGTLGDPDTDAGWDLWREAMAKDGMNVSPYGKASAAEDFAESWALWLPVAAQTRARGKTTDALRSAREAELVAMFPNRVKVMETILRTGKAP